MSLISIDASQIKALYNRQPFATIRDLEQQTTVARHLNAALIVYILHVSKQVGPVEFQQNPKRKLAAKFSTQKTELKHWCVIVADSEGTLGAFFVSNKETWQHYIRNCLSRKPLAPGELALLWPVSVSPSLFFGATVLKVDASTMVISFADNAPRKFRPKPDVWTFFSNTQHNINWASTNWQIVLIRGCKATVGLHTIRAERRCTCVMCGGHNPLVTSGRALLCEVGCDTYSTYLGYTYTLDIQVDKTADEDASTNSSDSEESSNEQPEKTMQALCSGHIGMFVANKNWPTLTEVSFPEFEQQVKQVFNEVDDVRVDLNGWLKISEKTKAGEEWMLGDACIHVTDMQFSAPDGHTGRRLLPEWKFKTNSDVKVAYKPLTPAESVAQEQRGKKRQSQVWKAKHQHSPAEPGYRKPCGIPNVGGTCASVAMLQLLLCAPALCDAILENPIDGVHMVLARIIDKLSNQATVPTKKELRQLHQQIALQAGYQQHDVNGIDCAELFATLPTAIPSLLHLVQLAQNPVPRAECGHIFTFSPFADNYFLRVAAPMSKKASATLPDLVAAKTTTPLDIQCGTDKCDRRIQSAFCLMQWPQFLLVHVDRQYHDDKGKIKTARGHVVLPKIMTVTAGPDFADRRFIYEVRGFACHEGSSSAGGHWTATVCAREHPEIMWQCNDEHVARVQCAGAGILQWPHTSRTVSAILYENIRTEGQLDMDGLQEEEIAEDHQDDDEDHPDDDDQQPEDQEDNQDQDQQSEQQEDQYEEQGEEVGDNGQDGSSSQNALLDDDDLIGKTLADLKNKILSRSRQTREKTADLSVDQTSKAQAASNVRDTDTVGDLDLAESFGSSESAPAPVQPKPKRRKLRKIRVPTLSSTDTGSEDPHQKKKPCPKANHKRPHAPSPASPSPRSPMSGSDKTIPASARQFQDIMKQLEVTDTGSDNSQVSEQPNTNPPCPVPLPPSPASKVLAPFTPQHKRDVLTFSRSRSSSQRTINSLFSPQQESQPEWMANNDRIWLNTQYAEKDVVKQMGAVWDAEVRRWWITTSADMSLFKKWIIKGQDWKAKPK